MLYYIHVWQCHNEIHLKCTKKEKETTQETSHLKQNNLLCLLNS
jgi:hypothetical protein